MWASNVKDEFNTEWQPGRVQQIYLPLSRGPGIMETKRTKHNYISRMTAGNVQDDRVNTNTCTEWRPGILRTKRHYQTHFTRVMNTENVQQDGGEETQISEDGIRNFEDKTPWNVLLNTIYSQIKNDVLRISAFWKTHSRKLISMCNQMVTSEIRE